jgi:hypothetical protein
MTEPPGYALESTLREGGAFIVHRGRRHTDACPVLVVALAAEEPSPQSLPMMSCPGSPGPGS